MDVNLQKVTTLLFDIGGVLVHLDGMPFNSKWLGPHATNHDVWRCWNESDAVRDLESGRISEDEFVASFIQRTNLNVSADKFHHHFLHWPRVVFDDVHNALEELSHTYRLAALSNSSALHWPRLMDELRLAEFIPDCISSHQLGVMKPHPDTFHTVLEKLEIEASEVLFLDDLQANVDAAQSLGLQAIHVTGGQGVVPVLKQLGLLTEATERQAI